LRSILSERFYRTPILSPGRAFFQDSVARIRDHALMMCGVPVAVNVHPGRVGGAIVATMQRAKLGRSDVKKLGSEKKAGPKEPGLRYWPN
jgi:hypothetical protein